MRRRPPHQSGSPWWPPDVHKLYSVSFVLFIVYVIVVIPLLMTMGQRASILLTPLELVLQHFKDFKKQAADLGLEVTPGDLTTLCQLEWPTFEVDWPDVGTFDLSICYRVQQVIFRRPGHTDQILCIMAWISLVEDRPPWLKQSLLSPPRPPTNHSQSILASRPATRPEKSKPEGMAPILPQDSDDLDFPPPYVTRVLRANSTSFIESSTDPERSCIPSA